jgi:DNA-binding transcriptional regulator YiaG
MKRTNLTGGQIRSLRVRNNLKQRQCADIIGVGLRAWQGYENDKPCRQMYIDMIQSFLNQK